MGECGTEDGSSAAASTETAVVSGSDSSNPSTARSGSEDPATIAMKETERPGSTRIVVKIHTRHRRLLQIVTAVLLVILTVEWVYLTTRRPEPLPIQRGPYFQTQFRVEINSATWVEWLQLEGIGPSLAHRIVADRQLNGPFKSIEDITRVPGIGPTTLDRIRGWLTIRHDLSDSTTSEARDTRNSARRPTNERRQPASL